MVLSTCRFCEHSNPAESKFCSECGGSLSLLPCPRCGAISDIAAGTCYQCGSQLPGRGTDTLAPPLTATAVAVPSPRRRSQMIIGTVVLAVFAMLGYYAYHQRTLVDASQPSAASSEPRGRSGPASAGIIRKDAAAVDTVPAKADNSTRPATSPPGTPSAGPTPAAVNEPRADRQPLESREAKAVAAPIARTPADERGSIRERGASPSQGCTEAAATLGLCAPKLIQKKEAETAAATKAAIARPRAIDAGKAGKTEPLRREACTEAATALGLCAPTPTVPEVTHTQRKE